MFTAEQRDRVRERLLELARADEDVLGAAITGSYAAGGGDEWSDVDLAFAIRGDLEPAVERWTEILPGELGAVHHWDLRFRGTVYRVFLLPSGLEIDSRSAEGVQAARADVAHGLGEAGGREQP